MSSVLMIIIAIMLIAVYMATIWYLIRTIIIMGKKSTLMAALGFLFSPIAQIVFYLSNKQLLTTADKKDFTRFWLLMVSVFVIVIVGMFIVFASADMG